MAVFATDFSEYATGHQPADWTERWVAGGQRLSVEAVPGEGNVLRHVILEHSRRAWSWDAVGGADDVDIVTRLRASDADARLGVVARGAGSGRKRGGEYGWTSEIDFGGYRFRTCSYDPRQRSRPDRPHGNGSLVGDTWARWHADEWHWLRLQLRVARDGYVAMKARLWVDGTGEPSSWQHEHDRTDPAHLGRRGWVGITGQTSIGLREYAWFGVGTDGDRAPLPS